MFGRFNLAILMVEKNESGGRGTNGKEDSVGKGNSEKKYEDWEENNKDINGVM